MTRLEKMDLFGNLNISPISLEFERGVTNTEWLLSIQSRVNEMIDFVNGLDETSQNYTDECINGLKELINIKVEEITLLITLTEQHSREYTNTEIDKLKTILTERIASIENLITLIQNNINGINIKINDINNAIKGGSIKVLNPVTGVYSSVQEALNSIYNNIRVTVTWDDINTLNLSWLQIEQLNRTWFEFEYKIKEFLFESMETMFLSTNI